MKVRTYLKQQFLNEENTLKYTNKEIKSKCVDIMVKIAKGKLKFEDVSINQADSIEDNIKKATKTVVNEMGYGLTTTGQNISGSVQLMDDYVEPSLYNEYVGCVASPDYFSDVVDEIKNLFSGNKPLDKENMTEALGKYKALKMAYDKKCESSWFRFKTHLWGTSAAMKTELGETEAFMVSKGITISEIDFIAENKWNHQNISRVVDNNTTIHPIVDNPIKSQAYVDLEEPKDNEITNIPTKNEVNPPTVEKDEDDLTNYI